jgi:transposase-like protein
MEFIDVDDFIIRFPNDKETEKALMACGALKDEMLCKKCGKNMKLLDKKDRIVFRCVQAACGKHDVSCRNGSVFFGSRLSCRKIMKIARAWLQGESRDAAVLSSKVNKETITEWYLAFREMVATSLREVGCRIGGPGIIVQVDETKLGRRKYYRGHKVEGVWVVCGIERTVESKIFCVQVDSRDAGTLNNIIRQHVIEGSEVWTDGWKGYNGIAESCRVRHSVVNHSLFFKDPETGICTNAVEGLNSALKATIPPQHRTEKFASACLSEFIWKRENKGRTCEAFIELLRNCLM